MSHATKREGPTLRWAGCGWGDVDGRIHTDCYPKGTPELRQPGEELPLNQVSCELDPGPPKVTALQGGRRLELARWCSEDVLPHLTSLTQPSPSRALPTGTLSAGSHGLTLPAGSHWLTLAHTGSHWLTLTAGSHWPLSHTVSCLTVLGARGAFAIPIGGRGASKQRRREAGRPAYIPTSKANRHTNNQTDRPANRQAGRPTDGRTYGQTDR